MKMNLPNRLTVLRLCLVPVLLIVGMLPNSIIPHYVSCFVCAALFIGTAVTDMLDGKIARRDGLITDFGKFLDPVADKFMVIGALFVLLHKFDDLRTVLIFTLIIVVFRELAVTSMRMVVTNTDGVVIAANWLGKVKTCVQIVFILAAIIEPMFDYKFLGGHAVSYVAMIAMTVMTVWSGYVYFKGYWKYINPSV